MAGFQDGRGAPPVRRRKPRLLLTGATPQKTYRIAIERFLVYLRRERRSQLAGEVTRDDVEDFVLTLLDLEYAASTAKLWLTAVQVFFRWLVEQGALATSPAEHVASPQIPERDHAR